MELPRRYGHYVLLERIAVGGMGEIFRAKYAGLAGFERLCAIKRILPHLSDDEEFVDRLISEAMIAVQLSHANIVQVYELGKIESEYFIAMEWVDGPDLSTLQVRAKAKDIPMPLALSIHVVHEIARAVDYAHRKTDADGKHLQIVHRDISPQNVMLSLDGGVKLGDFGIARAGGIARRFATGMGAILGKRRYMSPEQRRGESVDARTDVYSLGALLYESVTGHAPDPDEPIPPMSSEAAGVPPELDALASAALAYEPSERLAAAAELVEGLERVFVRMASAPGAIRDPGPELGKYVRAVCPPGEKLPQKRSLTSRIRAAMPPGAGARPTPGDVTGTSSGRALGDAELETGETDGALGVAEVELPHAADGITIVRSAIIPSAQAAIPRMAARTSETEAVARPPAGTGESTETSAVPAAVFADVTASSAPPPATTAPAPPGVLPGGAAGEATLTAARPGPAEDVTVLEARLPAPGAAVPTSAPSGAGAASALETVVAPRNADLARPSRAPVNAVEIRRPVPSRPGIPRPAAAGAMETAVGPAPAAEPRTRESDLFPSAARPGSRRAAAAALAGAGVIALVIGGAWQSGLFTRGGAVTPEPVAAASATPFPARTPRPRRTVARPSPTPTPRPEPAATPAPARTRVVVATPAPTRRPAYGTLVVNAKPWARVTVDGREIGQTPVKGLRLAAGSHRVRLEHPTLGQVERVIHLRGNETEKVLVDFKSLPAGPGPGSP